MKFKFSTPVLYGIFILIIAITLIIVVSSGDSKNDVSQTPGDAQTQLPNDDIHKQMGKNDGNEAPSKANVSAEFKKQFEDLKKDVEQGSKDTVKMREYADLCAQSHQPDEALKYYRKILELNPKRSDIYMNMSFVSFSLGKYDEAKASIEKALQVDKNNALALFNLGIIEAAIGQMDKAKSRWEEVVSRFPKSEIAATAKEQLDRLNQKK